MSGLVIEPFLQYGFLRTGLIVALLVGGTCAVLSCFLVVRRQALLGDAISHAVLPGVVLGYLLADRAGLLPGALLAAVATSLLITALEHHAPIARDAAMGIAFTAAFALGLVILSATEPRGIDLFHVLFGNVLGVAAGDVAVTAVSSALVLITVLALFPYLHLWSFDPRAARAAGLPTRTLDYIFTVVLAATIVAALQAVGIILVVAMLITPGATALLWASRLRTMLVVAWMVGSLAAVAGLYGSFHLDVASGPAMVLAASGLFAVSLVVGPRRRLFIRRRGDAARPGGTSRGPHEADPDALDPRDGHPSAGAASAWTSARYR